MLNKDTRHYDRLQKLFKYTVKALTGLPAGLTVPSMTRFFTPMKATTELPPTNQRTLVLLVLRGEISIHDSSPFYKQNKNKAAHIMNGRRGRQEWHKISHEQTLIVAGCCVDGLCCATSLLRFELSDRAIFRFPNLKLHVVPFIYLGIEHNSITLSFVKTRVFTCVLGTHVWEWEEARGQRPASGPTLRTLSSPLR